MALFLIHLPPHFSSMFRLIMDSFVMFKTDRTNAKLVSPFHVWCKFLPFLSCVPFSDIILYEVGNKHTLFIDVCCKQGWKENSWCNNSESCRNHGEVSNPDANWIQRFVFHELTFRNILHPSCYGSVTTSINFSYIFLSQFMKCIWRLTATKCDYILLFEMLHKLREDYGAYISVNWPSDWYNIY
jgi:hypothetical protein